MKNAIAGVIVGLFVTTSLAASGPVAAKQDPGGSASIVTVESGVHVFPSAVLGRGSTLEAQVDSMVTQLDNRLSETGGIATMMQHTLYVRDGVADPIKVLGLFHAAATGIAPSLKTQPSVGTILRVPALPDNAMVMIDVVAVSPSANKSLTRVPFTFGPKEIVETITTESLVFTSGFEAMDFENGTLAPTLDEQVDMVVLKLDGALRKVGLSLRHMVSHNLYIQRGTDPAEVIRKFHDSLRRLDPRVLDYPSVGALAIVDGMAVPGFKLEMDFVATKGDPAGVARTQFPVPVDIAQSATAGGYVLTSGIVGIDYKNGSSIASGASEQAVMTARNLHAALLKSGRSIADVVKFKHYVKIGDNPEEAVRRFNAEASRLDPRFGRKRYASTVVPVAGMAEPRIKFETSAVATSR